MQSEFRLEPPFAAWGLGPPPLLQRGDGLLETPTLPGRLVGRYELGSLNAKSSPEVAREGAGQFSPWLLPGRKGPTSGAAAQAAATTRAPSCGVRLRGHEFGEAALPRPSRPDCAVRLRAQPTRILSLSRARQASLEQARHKKKRVPVREPLGADGG
jgi:hypothetical protein